MSNITILGLALCFIFHCTSLLCYLSSRPYCPHESREESRIKDQSFAAKRFKMICLNVTLLVISCFISYFGTL